MRFDNQPPLFRLGRLVPLATALVGISACSVDATKFSCTTSAECPSGYHCDLGTATAAGSLKCTSGAPQQKTLTANATKFLLLKRPSADGTVRTTIAADIGAVTSTPDFVGVRAIASQGGKDLANSQVLADGSVLQFQLPQALTQVALRIQDDSGRSIPVSGYPEQVELSFIGKEVAGNTNPNAAYDVTTTSDSLYAPATWIASGPGPGGTAKEFTVADTLLPDGSIQSSASYTSIGYLDYHTASTVTPAQPRDPSGTFTGSSVGWQEFAQIPTTEDPAGGPPARIGATLSLIPGGLVLYGGADAAGNAADVAGTFYSFNSFDGWTRVVPTAGPPNAVPGSNARAGVALGYGGSTSCAAPCTQFSFQFSMAGGVINAAGALTDRVVAFGTQSIVPATGNPVTTTGWFDVGALPIRNAGMASAPAQVPISNSTTTGSFESFAGMVMVGGQAIVSAAANDANGCMIYAGYPNGSASLRADRSISCNDGSFTTLTGGIGFRSGVTLVPVDATTFLLFGGNKTGGSAGNGLKNDLWQGKLACNVIAPNAFCTTQITWTPLTPAGTPPPARANAGGGIWETTFTFAPLFSINRKLAIYGGTDATGAPLNDGIWEYDITSNTWRQVPLDGGGALAPAARTKFTMAGDGFHAYLFGGVVAGTPTDQMWLTTREAAARILVKAPFSLPAIDQATAMKISVDGAGLVNSQAFLWDGTKWRFIGTSAFDFATGFHLLASPTAAATGFLAPDGNIYLLLVGTGRATTQFAGSPVAVDRLKLTVAFQ